jgi:hypothetical protein
MYIQYFQYNTILYILTITLSWCLSCAMFSIINLTLSFSCDIAWSVAASVEGVTNTWRDRVVIMSCLSKKHYLYACSQERRSVAYYRAPKIDLPSWVFLLSLEECQSLTDPWLPLQPFLQNRMNKLSYLCIILAVHIVLSPKHSSEKQIPVYWNAGHYSVQPLSY